MLFPHDAPVAEFRSASAADLHDMLGRLNWTKQSNLSKGLTTGAFFSGGQFVHHPEEKLKRLMLAGLAGDSAAHREFLTFVSRPLRAFLASRLVHTDPSSTEDLLQDILLAIHLRRGTYDPTKPVTAWIYAIARYKLIDHYRRQRRRGISVPIEDIDGLFSADRADATDAARDVDTLLSHLPEKQRAAIEHVKLQEMSVREAAIQSGLSESDIKVSIHRGLKKLAAMLAARGKS